MRLLAFPVLLATVAPLLAGDVQVTIDATVFSNSAGGPLVGAGAGDAVTVSFQVDGTGTVIAPGQFAGYTIDPTTFGVTDGSGTVTGTSGSLQFSVINDFPVADRFDVGFAAIGGGYTFEMTASNSTGAMVGSVDLLTLFGTYPAPSFDSINFASLVGAGGTLELSLDAITIGAAGPDIGCAPANPHYLGGATTLATSTLGSGIGSGLHLEATDGPSGEFGFVLVAATGTSSLSVFEGVLCLDNPQGRYNSLVATNQGLPQLDSLGQFDGGGVLQNLVGTSTVGSGFDVPLELPFTPAGATIQPGDSFAFQVWHRDQDAGGGPSANFSDMVVVTFP